MSSRGGHLGAAGLAAVVVLLVTCLCAATAPTNTAFASLALTHSETDTGTLSSLFVLFSLLFLLSV
jgi:hypothetical protein